MNENQSTSKEIFDLSNINLLEVIDALEAVKVIAVGIYSEKMIRKALNQNVEYDDDEKRRIEKVLKKLGYT